jgi:hypothetical protein
MRKWLVLQLCSLGLLLVVSPQIAPAYAQATRTWVSGVGDDVNPCSRTAPCKTFAGAISKTALNGEINCLDPAGYGAVTITKSITIDCKHTLGSILNAGTNAVNIPFNNFTAPGETRKTVRLRGLAMNGADSGVAGIRITGDAASANSAVFVEDCVIDGNFGGIARGISDERAGGGELYVSDTTVRNTGQTGILIAPLAGGAGARIDAVLRNVRVENSNFGVAAGNAVRLMISRSVFTGNTVAGVGGIGSTALEVNVDQTVVSSNGTGLSSSGSVTLRFSNSDIAFNATAITGATLTFGNNRIVGNGTAGTAPTPISQQ